jgi:phosphate acetyltransferase
MELLKRAFIIAQRNRKRIVLPEGTDLKVLRAADIVLKEKLAHLILLGNPEEIKKAAESIGVELIGAELVDPINHPDKEKYAELMVQVREDKGLTKEEALELLNDPLTFAPLMILCGDADGELAGAQHQTGEVLRPAFMYIKKQPGITAVSGAFFMFVNDPHFGHEGFLVFADCSVIPEPNAHQLAEIAVQTARTTRLFLGIEPRVAMLSFSTKGSASHPLVDKVVEATRLAREMDPDLIIDGEMQLEVAIMPEVAQQLVPGSEVAGRANVLVFPGLESANIGYNLVQRLAKAEAIGPVLQGLSAPVNHISRGCTVSQLVNLITVTAIQAIGAQQNGV